MPRRSRLERFLAYLTSQRAHGSAVGGGDVACCVHLPRPGQAILPFQLPVRTRYIFEGYNTKLSISWLPQVFRARNSSIALPTYLQTQLHYQI